MWIFHGNIYIFLYFGLFSQEIIIEKNPEAKVVGTSAIFKGPTFGIFGFEKFKELLDQEDLQQESVIEKIYLDAGEHLRRRERAELQRLERLGDEVRERVPANRAAFGGGTRGKGGGQVRVRDAAAGPVDEGEVHVWIEGKVGPERPRALR